MHFVLYPIVLCMILAYLPILGAKTPPKSPAATAPASDDSRPASATSSGILKSPGRRSNRSSSRKSSGQLNILIKVNAPALKL